MTPNAIWLSMIVEITSLTLRVTLSTPAIPAHREPTTIATRMMNPTCRGAGNATSAPAHAAISPARRYWPSTPMLNRFIWNPIATATPAMNSGVAWLMIDVMPRERVL